jgi:hypothetical protein
VIGTLADIENVSPATTKNIIFTLIGQALALVAFLPMIAQLPDEATARGAAQSQPQDRAPLTNFDADRPHIVIVR